MANYASTIPVQPARMTKNVGQENYVFQVSVNLEPVALPEIAQQARSARTTPVLPVQATRTVEQDFFANARVLAYQPTAFSLMTVFVAKPLAKATTTAAEAMYAKRVNAVAVRMTPTVAAEISASAVAVSPGTAAQTTTAREERSVKTTPALHVRKPVTVLPVNSAYKVLARQATVPKTVTVQGA